MLKKFFLDESGATAIEYGLIAGLIALGMVGGATAFGNSLEYLWTDNNSRLVQSLD